MVIIGGGEQELPWKRKFEDLGTPAKLCIIRYGISEILKNQMLIMKRLRIKLEEPK